MHTSLSPQSIADGITIPRSRINRFAGTTSGAAISPVRKPRRLRFMRVTLRPTVPEDLPHCIAEPLPHRIKAITASLGDKVIGIGGIGFRPDGVVEAFVQQLPEAKNYPVAFHRAGLMAMKMIRDSGLRRVVATTGADYPTGQAWLQRLGFWPAEVQDCPGKVIYVWERGGPNPASLTDHPHHCG